MDRLPIGEPKVSGVGGIPEPFNVNDELVITRYICIYLCNNPRFQRSDFLNLILDDTYKIAYDSSGLSDALTNYHNVFNQLIEYSLKKLLYKNLVVVSNASSISIVEFEQYSRSVLLELFCSKIEEYDVSIIEELIRSILVAEKELKKEDNYKFILEYLENLDNGYVNDDTKIIQSLGLLSKLNQLGLITVSIDNRVKISSIGHKLLEYQSKRNHVNHKV